MTHALTERAIPLEKGGDPTVIVVPAPQGRVR